MTSLLQQSDLAYYLGVPARRILAGAWRYLFFFHPIRVLRILFGIGADTLEEQLGLFLRVAGTVCGDRQAGSGLPRPVPTACT